METIINKVIHLIKDNGWVYHVGYVGNYSIVVFLEKFWIPYKYSFLKELEDGLLWRKTIKKLEENNIHTLNFNDFGRDECDLDWWVATVTSNTNLEWGRTVWKFEIKDWYIDLNNPL